MEHDTVGLITRVIAYIEAHLNEKLDLDTVASAVHYSKYHLHRMFTDTVGMTIHDYVRRRRLTEAAKLLVFSDLPILEVALAAGYESRQAFTGIFRDMYKQTPLEYRECEVFYPLQLRFTLQKTPAAPGEAKLHVSYASREDIPDWMALAALVIDGFPCFEAAEHREWLKRQIEQRQAFVIRDRALLAGAAAYSRRTGSIDFLGVHPQYRRHGIAEAFLNFILHTLSAGRRISITTFREGDKADTGQRAFYQELGFVESEFLTEFGYPVQRFVLKSGQEESGDA